MAGDIMTNPLRRGSVGNRLILHLTTSYAAQLARFMTWLIVVGLVYRSQNGKTQLALLLLVRGTVGLLSYCSAGLLPVLVPRLTASTQTHDRDVEADQSLSAGSSDSTNQITTSPDVLYTSALCLAGVICLSGLAIALIYAGFFSQIHELGTIHANANWVVITIAIAVCLRAISDIPGAVLQAGGRLGSDNFWLIGGELLFLATALFFYLKSSGCSAGEAGFAMAVGAGFTALGRDWHALLFIKPQFNRVNWQVIKVLFASGFVVLISQLADWLYAPVNMILLDQYLPASAVANYGVAIQVDAALLLLISGISTVLLPYAARAAHLNQWQDLKKYYCLGTTISIILLAGGGAVVWVFSEQLFTWWFDDSMPITQTILPYVLVHTVIGGSASIARSILFGMGKINIYACSAIVGGVINAILSWWLIAQTNLGLYGIVYATIITVTLRCGIWLPIYTLWSIRTCKRQSNRINQPAHE